MKYGIKKNDKLLRSGVEASAGHHQYSGHVNANNTGNLLGIRAE